MSLVNECRAKVRQYEASQSQPEPQMSDYRDGLLAGYFEDAAGLDDMLPEVGKEFTERAGQLRSAMSLNPNDPAAIVKAGQDFSSGILASAGAGDLAQSLFDSASDGAANTGLMAVEDAMAALKGFEAVIPMPASPPPPSAEDSRPPAVAVSPLPSEPMYREPFQVFDVPVERQQSRPDDAVEQANGQSCGHVPAGKFLCTPEGLRTCVCRNGRCELSEDWAGCSPVGSISD